MDSIQGCCKICQNFYVSNANLMTEKVYKNCFKYLHNSIIEKNSEIEKCRIFTADMENPSICSQCFESAVRLTDLNDELETLQKSIHDFIFTFSVSVLHRRDTVKNEKPKPCTVEISDYKLPEVFSGSEQQLNYQNSFEVQDPLFLIPVPEEGIGENRVKIENYCPAVSHYIHSKEDEFILSNVHDDLTATPTRFEQTLKKSGFCHGAGATDNNDIDREGESSANIHSASQPANSSKTEILSRKRCSKMTTASNKKVKMQVGRKQDLYCVKCKILFSKRGNYVNHMRMHTVETPFQCMHCTKSHLNQGTLTRHVRETHDVKYPYKCKECPKLFFQLLDRDRHLEFHKMPSFHCQYCMNSYTNSENRDRHERTHTDHQKQFKCQHCEKSFSTNTCLNIHMKFHAR